MTVTPETAMDLFHTAGLKPHELAEMRRGLLILNHSDPLFLPLVERMLTTGNEHSRDVTERELVDVLTTGNEKYKEVYSRSRGGFSSNHTENSLLIENVFFEWCILNFVEETHFAFNVEELIFATETGDHYFSEHAIPARPRPPYRDVEEGHRYYSSLAVVSHIIDPNDYPDKFIEETPAFMKWAMKQSDLNSVLNSALRFNTITPKTIKDAIDMLDETTPPLHGGLL